MSSTPPPAPASTPVADVSAGSGAGAAQKVSSTLGRTISRVKAASLEIYKQQKPWSEVLDRSVISRPESFGQALSRLKRNALHFRTNYFVVMLVVTCATFLLHPGSLIVVGLLLAAWVYVLVIREAPLIIGGRTLSSHEKTLLMYAVSFITIFFLTSVGTVFFSALSLSLAVIALHGACREPDNLFTDESEDQLSFLSIFTGNSQAAATLALASAV